MKVTLISAAILSCTQAWWDGGHLLTARRAYDLLEVENPEALYFANALLAPLKRHYPDITSQEGNYPFVEAAIFPDEPIVRTTYPEYTVWHYINYAYMIDGGSIEDFPDFNPAS
jgi:hypothetical protein